MEDAVFRGGGEGYRDLKGFLRYWLNHFSSSSCFMVSMQLSTVFRYGEPNLSNITAAVMKFCSASLYPPVAENSVPICAVVSAIPS